jgi:hypothetical protein
MKKVLKIIVGFIVLSLIVFGLYLYDLHTLAVEGNRIFALRCTEVNVPLIAYKNSFLNFADSLKNPGKYTNEQMKSFYDGYISGMRDYEPKENDWIETQRTFINRLDFKLIEPWYVKEAGTYQVQMYEGYRDEALTTIDAIDGRITTDEYETRFNDARARRNKYTDLYNGVFDKALPIHDWRKIFASVPIPKECNDQNLTIPDTSGALNTTPAPARVEDPEITG